jgi:site-specific recombinase XerD
MGELYKRESGATWYADYVDRNGKRVRKSTKMKDKQLAKKVLAMWEDFERQIEVGLKSASKTGELLQDHLRKFEQAKFGAGKSDCHIARTSQLIDLLAKHCGWKTLGDISADGIHQYVEHLRLDSNASSRTIGSVITAIRTFCRWLVRTGIMPSDPTATVDKPSVKTDRRIERRMLLPEEWKWLKKWLESSSDERNGQSSRERLLMYELAIETGLRSSELRSLTKANLCLEGSDPHVKVKAAITKNAVAAKQYLSDGLAQKLSKALARKLPGASVFATMDRTRMAGVLRQDIDNARKLWLTTEQGKEEKDTDFLKSPNSEGEIIDFHALRHTCGAWLVMKGVTLAEVQAIMRHSTIVLTVECYGHLAPDARSRSRNVLGSMLG